MRPDEVCWDTRPPSRSPGCSDARTASVIDAHCASSCVDRVTEGGCASRTCDRRSRRRGDRRNSALRRAVPQLRAEWRSVTTVRLSRHERPRTGDSLVHGTFRVFAATRGPGRGRAAPDRCAAEPWLRPTDFGDVDRQAFSRRAPRHMSRRTRSARSSVRRVLRETRIITEQPVGTDQATDWVNKASVRPLRLPEDRW